MLLHFHAKLSITIQSLKKNLNNAEKVVQYLKYRYFVIRGG